MRPCVGGVLELGQARGKGKGKRRGHTYTVDLVFIPPCLRVEL